MTYHADLAPRRRSWLIATPLVLVVVIQVVLIVLWNIRPGIASL